MVSESTIGSTDRPLRIAITGGGTGGHVSPGVAVVEALGAQCNIEPLWIGSRGGFEDETTTQLGIPFKPIQVGKLRRYPSLKTIVDAAKIPIGIGQAWLHLRKFRADVLFATGGYVSTPVVIAASKLGVPSLTHEQTAHIGLATKINSRYVDVVALSYERSRQPLGETKARIVVTGNPVRDVIKTGNRDAALRRYGFTEDLPLVYVTGGALGASAINIAVAGALPELLQHVQVLHQCGPRTANDDFATLSARAKQLPSDLRPRYQVVERVGAEIGDLFAAASLVVGRAGAGTIAELAAIGRPAILIPLPGAHEQHQNAMVLSEAGAAVLVPQTELSSARLSCEILNLIREPRRVEAMSDAARHVASEDPASHLVDELKRLATRNNVRS